MDEIEYNAALTRIEELMGVEGECPELMLLVRCVEEYEDKHYPMKGE